MTANLDIEARHPTSLAAGDSLTVLWEATDFVDGWPLPGYPTTDIRIAATGDGEIVVQSNMQSCGDTTMRVRIIDATAAVVLDDETETFTATVFGAVAAAGYFGPLIVGHLIQVTFENQGPGEWGPADTDTIVWSAGFFVDADAPKGGYVFGSVG